jgi:Fic family protein
MTYKPPYTLTSKILTLSTKITEELTKIEHNQEHLLTLKLRKKNHIKTLAGTLEIEGNFLGEEKITAILEGKRVLATAEELAEVEGAIAAYKGLETYNSYNLEDLLTAHKVLMRGILKNAGTFRTVQVGVAEHIAPPPSVVPKLMQELFTWLKDSDEHPLIKSSVFHYEFEFIHPFADGNGRLGRLWQSLILCEWKKVFNSVPTESIVRDYQEEYYQAIEASTKLGESTPFIEFMLEVILKTLENVPKDVPYNVPKERVELILDSMKENPSITLKDLANLVMVSEKTIKRDIEKMKQEGKVKRTGSARKGSWNVL